MFDKNIFSFNDIYNNLFFVRFDENSNKYLIINTQKVTSNLKIFAQKIALDIKDIKKIVEITLWESAPDSSKVFTFAILNESKFLRAE